MGGGVQMADSITKLCLSWRVPHYSFLWFSWRPPSPIMHLFLRPRRLPPYLHSILATCFIIPHTTASFPRQLCVHADIKLIYILTRYKPTPLSAIIITHLVKGSAQFLLHLRRPLQDSPSGALHTHLRRRWYPNSLNTHPPTLPSTVQWRLSIKTRESANLRWEVV